MGIMVMLAIFVGVCYLMNGVTCKEEKSVADKNIKQAEMLYGKDSKKYKDAVMDKELEEMFKNMELVYEWKEK